MRKFFLLLAFLIVCLISGATITWANSENILAHFLAKELHVPVSIHALDIGQTSVKVSKVWIGNFHESKSSTLFTVEETLIGAKGDEFFKNPLIIENIDLNHIFVGIEFYDQDQKDSNWSRMLKEKPGKKKNPKDYLIRTLTLRDLTVEVTTSDGKIKRYPTIKQMEFHNIGSESGFPVAEIEKTIFNLMMKGLIRKLDPPEIFNQYSPVKIPLISETDTEPVPDTENRLKAS